MNSPPSLLAMKTSVDESALLSLLINDTKPFALMALPVELRIKILGYLFPSSLEPKVQDQSTADYRPNGEPRHPAVLRVNHQLYAEGTVALYNRAFRVTMFESLIWFLNWTYETGWEYDQPTTTLGLESYKRERDSWNHERYNHERLNHYGFDIPLKPSKILSFPFHRVKQVQIELWPPIHQCRLYSPRNLLVGLCSIFYNQPSLKNIRIDFRDESYMESCFSQYFDDDQAHPAKDKYYGKMDLLTEEEVQVRRNQGYDFWERESGTPGSSHDLCCEITDLELFLQPFKRLYNVGRARINMTPSMEKDEDVGRLVRECEEAMMSKGPLDESETAFMEWCTDPSEPWNLALLFG